MGAASVLNPPGKGAAGDTTGSTAAAASVPKPGSFQYHPQGFPDEASQPGKGQEPIAEFLGFAQVAEAEAR